MENKCVLHIEKLHTFTQLNAMQKHNNREISLPNIDKNKSYENKVLFSYGKAYTNAWRDIIQKQELKNGKKMRMRRDAVKALDIMLTFSKDSDINIEQWSNVNLLWLKKKFGEENIIACTLHMDETTPHIHAEVVPIIDGRLSAKAVLGGRKAMMDMQTSYGEAMSVCGLERGNKASKSKKKTLVKFYSSVNKAATAKLPPKMRGEDDNAYLSRMEEYCRTMKLAYEQLLLRLEEEKTITTAKIAEEFSKYTTAISFYEDLYDKYDADADCVSERITLYRRIENMMPKKDLDSLLKNITERYKASETPLVNWARLGNHAIDKKKWKESQEAQATFQSLLNGSQIIKDDFELYRNNEIDE